ncbi:hypothetical protein OUZ56_019455 [Daphnia magna]|uniref:Uncharacterized protein n=1 Tax=Daphnia magna TaxID=35525 RepID=A0ABQ9ZBM3_9CRUS|nr:hypothetical protein OUZ56_019455 [Daphnia magna]
MERICLSVEDLAFCIEIDSLSSLPFSPHLINALNQQLAFRTRGKVAVNHCICVTSGYCTTSTSAKVAEPNEPRHMCCAFFQLTGFTHIYLNSNLSMRGQPVPVFQQRWKTATACGTNAVWISLEFK